MEGLTTVSDMSVLSVKGHRILAGLGHRNSSTYRSIMEMLARFGYGSIREVMYDQKISLRTAIKIGRAHV